MLEISDAAGTRRVQWFGHVERRREGEVLSQVEGRRLRGRPKKSCMELIEDDMIIMGLDETLAGDRQRWKKVVIRVVPQIGN